MGGEDDGRVKKGHFLDAAYVLDLSKDDIGIG